MSNTVLNQADANRLVLEAFDSGWRSYTPLGLNFFTKVDPERVDERFSVHGSDSDIPEVAEGAAFPAVNIEQLGIITAAQRVFKREIPVTKLMQRFDNYGVVLEEAGRLGYRARYTMDQVMADIFNNGFTTTTCWDGLSLFNDAHLVGATGATQDNRAAVDITKANLNAGHVALQLQQDHGGHRMPTTGKYLAVNPNDQMTAWELLGSPTDPETGDRSLNFIHSLGLSLVSWPLLTDVDAWFLIAEKMFNRLRFAVALEPTVNYVRSTENGNYLYQVDFACVGAAPDYLGTYGSTGV